MTSADLTTAHVQSSRAHVMQRPTYIAKAVCRDYYMACLMGKSGKVTQGAATSGPDLDHIYYYAPAKP
jgi:hypothetical protein